MIRLWKRTNEDEGDLHGEIRHVTSGNSARFSGLKQLHALIEQFVQEEQSG